MRVLNRYLVTVCLSAFMTLAGLTWLTGFGLTDAAKQGAESSLAALGEPSNPLK